MDGTKYYNANFVFDKQKEMEYILFDEGRIVNDNNNFTFECHLKDHLGSVRVAFVPTTSGTEIVQENAYYPFGGTIDDFSYNASENRYKHTGMEAIDDFGLNMLDNNARWRDVSAVPRFYGIDPLAEKYYSISPYAYCGNNPIKNIDPTGEDWYSFEEEYKNEYGEKNTRTVYRYTDQYRSQAELDKAGIDGKYLGITTKTNDKYYSLLGETFDLKNKDGSLTLSAQIAEKLDNAIMDYYKGDNEESNSFSTRYTDMTISGLQPGKNFNFDYGSGAVTYFSSEDNSAGYMYWGSGKVQRLGSFQSNWGYGVNTFVKKGKGKEWDILFWRFKNVPDYQSTRKQIDKLLLNRTK